MSSFTLYMFDLKHHYHDQNPDLFLIYKGKKEEAETSSQLIFCVSS